MNIVPATYLTLVRARKEMQRAFDAGDWDGIRDSDDFLLVQLQQAFDDPEKDSELLAKELSTVLDLYSRMVESMPQDTVQQWLSV